MKYPELIQNEEFEAALNLINSIIKLNGVDKDLIQAKIFCLINLQKFTLVVSTIKSCRKIQNHDGSDFSFDLAYSYYRLGNFHSSIKVIDSTTDLQTRHLILKAQILYRLERFNESAGLYRELIQQNPENAELQVNYLAACALSGQLQLTDLTSTINSYDATYNRSIGSFLQKDFNTSGYLAKRCVELPDVSEKEIVNAQILNICSMIASGDNIPQAQFRLKDMSIHSKLDTIQRALVASNLLLCKSDVKCENTDYKNIASFDFQKLQFIANMYSYNQVALSKTEKNRILLQTETIFVSEDDIAQYVNKMNIVSISKISNNLSKKVKKTSTKPLDKERWIPLRDRSYFKKKLKKTFKK